MRCAWHGKARPWPCATSDHIHGSRGISDMANIVYIDTIDADQGRHDVTQLVAIIFDYENFHVPTRGD